MAAQLAALARKGVRLRVYRDREQFQQEAQSRSLRDMTANGAITHRISDSLYFVTMTITTVGYGDLMPATQLGRMFAALAALNGY